MKSLIPTANIILMLPSFIFDGTDQFMVKLRNDLKFNSSGETLKAPLANISDKEKHHC